MGMCGVCVGMHGCVWVCTGVCGCARVCAGVRMCARVCTGVHKCVQVYIHVRGWVMVCVGVHTRTWVGVGVHVCVWKFAEVRGCLRVCVLDEFSEYLLETGVNTSADFNTYPIRIFFVCICFSNFTLSLFKKNIHTHTVNNVEFLTSLSLEIKFF